MNVKFLNPFVEAADSVLRVETQINLKRGTLGLEKEPYVTNDVTVIISLVGRVDGTVFYSMSEATALELASAILGEPLEEFGALAQSGIAELGNVITGQASIKLSEAGYEATISPPTLLRGAGAIINTLDYPRLVVPLIWDKGSITIHLALREGAAQNFSTATAQVPMRPSL